MLGDTLGHEKKEKNMRVDEEQMKPILGHKLWICKRLSDIRVSRGFSMREISNRMGIDESRISDFEGDRNDYKVSTLLRYARVLNVSLDVLMRGCPGWTKAAPKSQMVILESSSLQEILKAHGVPEKKAIEIVSAAAARE
jgi:transcriptional regulator with XRE-family HTH domain